ncbi:MAG: glycosyltransferase family 1 protein, partial [Phycisphaerales bacterium]|nr:glycosyltransferase family 1 protein [Phycisphaerales bacterium]
PKPTSVMRRELDNDDPDVGAIRISALERVHRRIDRICERSGIGNAPRYIAHELAATQRDDWTTPLLDRLRLIDTEGVLVSDPTMFCRLTGAVRSMEQWVRPFTVAWLSRRCRVASFGQGTLEGWEADVTALGHVESQGEAYRLGRAGLNVMRGQDDEGLNLKPLEIASSGRACLCARRVGMEAIFDDDEIIAFDRLPEALDGLRRLEDDPSIAQRAMARIHRDWTWTAVNAVTLEQVQAVHAA